ncbi:UNVERIFIED_CONTAM: hypothetical protein GTU68_022312 [Idotea baltica]|nr:hypothetical protein [Idotea baltica]
MLDNINIDPELSQSTVDMAASWVREMRASGEPGLMESFLAEYGLSTQEGVALMCMAEAYLRVPDNKTLDDLIQDKIAPQNFGDHLGHSSSLMVNASTWGLMLTGSVLSDSDQRGLLPSLQKVVKRAGEPIIRVAVKRMMKMMGGQFVLGEDIESAIENGEGYTKKGYRYSFDMLGEAAYTLQDADRYYLAYADAITEIVEHCKGKDVRLNPGISVKLSALYPRYETLHKADVMKNLFPSLRSLCLLAKKAGIGLNIDAEEAERLDISLDIIEALLADGSLHGWDGLGIVVQAYSYRAPHVLDWLYQLAIKYDTKLMVRLVKGAYWDREIKRSQELGLPGYPVYTRKNNSDLSYWYCAQKLLNQRDRIFPQFATHNAHTIASILKMTENEEDASSTFEFQRLHGMGESLHELVRKKHDFPCRIYAPVGVHQDLLAYLVRRLLENGANASFVSQVLDNQIPPSEVTADPIKKAQEWLQQAVPGVAEPKDLFMPERTNSKGFDWLDVADIATMESLRAPFESNQWEAKPLVVGAENTAANEKQKVTNPATGDVVGYLSDATIKQMEAAIKSAHQAQPDWYALDVCERGRILNKAADLYEQHAGEFFALLAREAGKTIVDCIAELREAVDFLRYYAAQAENIAPNKKPVGVMACISPWNFPLAIFSGQLSAALAVGNAVLVKPAETTSMIAFRAVQLLHEAGVPEAILQYLPGEGTVIGAGLSSHPDISGMIFTGSTATAKHIETAMSQSSDVRAPLIAETGGLNAMIVDSSALPEQAITDIVASSFQSAGQRCSALRVLYLQEDIAEHTLEMLYGAMDLLKLGNPWQLNTDIGPVINEVAAKGINDYIEEHKDNILKQTPLININEAVCATGFFVPPTVIKVNGIQDISREIFGPVLHVATYKAEDIDKVIDAINNAGFGLTFGLHTRIDSRVQTIVDSLKVGNMYINRNQIGAIVGSQPFGGEGLSGTGPKAGGPFYLKRLVHSELSFTKNEFKDQPPQNDVVSEDELNKSIEAISAAKSDEFGYLQPLSATTSQQYLALINRCRHELRDTSQLPGPTGEDNLLSLASQGLTIVASQDSETAFQQALQTLYCGNPLLVFNANFNSEQQEWLSQQANVAVYDKGISPQQLTDIPKLANFVYTANTQQQFELAREYRIALAKRDGAIVRFIDDVEAPHLYAHERHLCINTTAAGGNVQLIANSE